MLDRAVPCCAVLVYMVLQGGGGGDGVGPAAAATMATAS